MMRRYPRIWSRKIFGKSKLHLWARSAHKCNFDNPNIHFDQNFWIPSYHISNSELQMSGVQYPKFTFQWKFLIFQLSASCFETFKKSNSQYMAQIRFRSCFMFFKQMGQSFFKARYSRLQSLWNHQYCKQEIFHIHIFDLWTNYEICTRFVLSEALQKPPVNFGRSRYQKPILPPIPNYVAPGTTSVWNFFAKKLIF